MKILNRRVFLCLIAVVALFATIFVLLISEKTAPNGINKSQQEQTKVVSVSPSGNEIIVLETDRGQGTQNLKISHEQTGSNSVLYTKNTLVEFHSFIWSSSGRRFYFGITDKVDNTTTLFFVDLDAPDPNAVTEVTYNDKRNLLRGQVTIARVAGNTLYLQVGEELFIIDLDQGNNAIPVEVSP